jgi:hypothetical protein
MAAPKCFIWSEVGAPPPNSTTGTCQ